MKKIFIFLLSLFPLISFANWDAVRTLNYWANFNSPFDINVEVINDACDTSRSYSWNIFSKLNVNGTSWTTCYKSWWKVKCTLSRANSDDRKNTISSGLNLVWDRAQILNDLWVESKIYSNFWSTYTHWVVADFGLLTDSNANDRFSSIEYSLNTGAKNLFNCGNTIRYFDNTECKEKYKTYEDVEVTNWSWVVTIEKRELPFEEVFYVNTSTSCSPTVVNFSNPIYPPVLSTELNIDWCEKKWNVLYCKSNTSSFKLNFKVTNGWTYNKLDYVNANINNEENTSSVIKNSTSTDFSVWNNSMEISLPKEKGKYTLEFSWYWKNGDWLTLSNLVTQKIVIIPNNDFKFSSWDYLDKVSWTNVYANNSDTYKFCKSVTDSNGNTLNDLSRILTTTIDSWFKTNRIDKTWDEALVIKSSTFDKVNSKACIEFAWLAPYKWDLGFKFALSKHDNLYEDIITDKKDLGIKVVNNIEFLKPFIWELTSSRDGSSFNYNPEVWTLMKYMLEAKLKTTNIETSNFRFNYSVNSNINLIGDNLEKQDFKVTDLEWKESFFEWRINYTGEDKLSTINPGVSVIKAKVIYTIWWKEVTYYISENINSSDTSPIKLEFSESKVNNSFIWVKIIGWILWEWNQDITWQDVNISELNSYEVRTQIRKNAYEYTKSLTSWSTVNGVHYVNWDFTISSNPNYETLVIKNWNLTIAWNITKPKFWVIVLSDWYSVVNWKNNKWNIFIKSDVTSLSWLYYADGWIMSVWTDSELLINDSFERTKLLQNQLTINWTIVTRNTIWWAILTSTWKYILPWGQTTDDFDLAMIFDLNYLRRWDVWTSDENKWYSTVIKYNPWLVLDPPKLFNN